MKTKRGEELCILCNAALAKNAGPRARESTYDPMCSACRGVFEAQRAKTDRSVLRRVVYERSRGVCYED